MKILKVTETEIIEGTKDIYIACPDEMTKEQALALVGDKVQEKFDEMEYSSSDDTNIESEWCSEDEIEDLNYRDEPGPDFDLTINQKETITNE